MRTIQDYYERLFERIKIMKKAVEDDLNQKQRPKIIDAPRLDISVESLEGLRLKSKVKEQGFEIPYPYTLADVEWVNTSVWYKPWTWGEGYLKLKQKEILSNESEKES